MISEVSFKVSSSYPDSFANYFILLLTPCFGLLYEFNCMKFARDCFSVDFCSLTSDYNSCSWDFNLNCNYCSYADKNCSFSDWYKMSSNEVSWRVIKSCCCVNCDIIDYPPSMSSLQSAVILNLKETYSLVCEVKILSAILVNFFMLSLSTIRCV